MLCGSMRMCCRYRIAVPRGRCYWRNFVFNKLYRKLDARYAFCIKSIPKFHLPLDIFFRLSVKENPAAGLLPNRFRAMPPHLVPYVLADGNDIIVHENLVVTRVSYFNFYGTGFHSCAIQRGDALQLEESRDTCRPVVLERLRKRIPIGSSDAANLDFRVGGRPMPRLLAME